RHQAHGADGQDVSEHTGQTGDGKRAQVRVPRLLAVFRNAEAEAEKRIRHDREHGERDDRLGGKQRVGRHHLLRYDEEQQREAREGQCTDHRDRHAHRLEQQVLSVNSGKAKGGHRVGSSFVEESAVRVRKASSRVAPRTDSPENGIPDFTSATTARSASRTKKVCEPSSSARVSTTSGSELTASAAGVVSRSIRNPTCPTTVDKSSSTRTRP